MRQIGPRSALTVALVGVIIATSAVGAAPSAGAVATAQRPGNVRSSLCSLRVAKQLRELGVGSDCSSTHVQPDNELAFWGLRSVQRTGRVVSLQVLAGLSEANARSDVPPRSLRVAVGSFAREWVAANKVELVAWAHHIEFDVTMGLRASSHPSLVVMTKFLTPTAAFAQAIAAQV